MVTKEQLDLLLERGELTQDQYNASLVEAIPSAWIETNVCNYEIEPDGHGVHPPLILRWYQRRVMNDTSRRKVLRIGRQAGKSHYIVCDAIYHTRVYQGTTAIIVVPYNHQCLLLFDKLTSFIEASPVLSDVKFSQTKNPFVLKWKDGGQIKLFTAGASSGGTADSVRGQTCRWLYVDEADYIPETALDAIIMTTSAYGNDARLVMSSTPQGPKTYFFEICANKRWQEFHYASQVNPSWTDEMDQTARDLLGPSGYKHEVLAEFSDAEAGIFRKDDIAKMFNISLDVDKQLMRTYTYADVDKLRPLMKTFLIGVDWNSVTHGTQIVIVGVGNTTSSILYLIEHIEIAIDKFTQLRAVEKVVALINKYNPLYVYVDEGYGTMQVEVLHRTGISNDATGLDEKVVGINFSSNLEVWDPITSEMKPKYAKGFMVDNMSRLAEQHVIHLPTDELISSGGNSRKKLESMLMGYILERVTPNGKPVYKCEGAEDHKFDALMLACLAYTQHYKKIADRQFGIKPMTPVIKPRKLYGDKQSETPIVSRQLGVGMRKDNLQRYTFHPEKEDYNDFLRRVAQAKGSASARSQKAKTNFAKVMSGNIVRRTW